MAVSTGVRTVALPSGELIPALGQGTWHMGEDGGRRDAEIAALRAGIELGLTLVDTAEMYGDGAAELVVGDAIVGRRELVFLVDKVLPFHANVPGTIQACEASLTRLGTDWIDLYLLHWPGPVPLEETLEAFAALLGAGKIRYWGVSNFEVRRLEELTALVGGDGVQTDQVLYNLSRRGIEWDLLPWCRARGLPVMAYSPIEQGRLAGDRVVAQIAVRHGATSAQVALAWVLRQEAVCAIPKAATLEHVRENRGALDLRLTDEDLVELDRAFPPPMGPRPLEVL
jgi:diketogulonate reductase-like aldo/keto reductase